MRGASARPRYHDDRFDQGWCTVCALVSDFLVSLFLAFRLVISTNAYQRRKPLERHPLTQYIRRPQAKSLSCITNSNKTTHLSGTFKQQTPSQLPLQAKSTPRTQRDMAQRGTSQTNNSKRIGFPAHNTPQNLIWTSRRLHHPTNLPNFPLREQKEPKNQAATRRYRHHGNKTSVCPPTCHPRCLTLGQGTYVGLQEKRKNRRYHQPPSLPPPHAHAAVVSCFEKKNVRCLPANHGEW